MTGCYKFVRAVLNYNRQYQSYCFYFTVYIAVPITAFITAVNTALIISSIVCIVARKRAVKTESISQEEPDITYGLFNTNKLLNYK